MSKSLNVAFGPETDSQIFEVAYLTTRINRANNQRLLLWYSKTRKFNGISMVTTITYAIWTGLSSKGQSMVNVYRVDKGLKPYELDGSKWAKTKHRVNDTTIKSYFKNS